MREQMLMTRRRVASAVPLAVLASASADAVAAPSKTDDDAALIQLGDAFEAAWSLQAQASATLDARHERLFQETAAVVSKIEQLPATSLAGLIVKARACAWTHGGEAVEPDFFAYDSTRLTTDVRLGAAILRDLLALSGRPVPDGDVWAR